MRSTLATITLAATAALVLGGCTIKFHGSDDPQRKGGKANAEQRAAKAGQAGSGTTAGGAAATEVTPRITAPIIFGNGTGGAFTGYAYVIPETTEKLPDLAQLVPFATLFTDSFNVAPQQFSGGFPGALVQEDWFALRYEGLISLPKDATWTFKVTSDDGAILYIDGAKVVDNDGRHTSKAATGQKELKAGRHQVRLDYFQAAKGPVALTVHVVEDGKDQLLTGVK